MRSPRTALSNWGKGEGIKGRETGPFARALAGDEDALVLDMWMAMALGADGRKATGLDNIAAARRRMQSIYSTLDITMAEAQAAVWCGIVRSRGGLPARFERAADGTIRLQTGATKPLFGDWV